MDFEENNALILHFFPAHIQRLYFSLLWKKNNVNKMMNFLHEMNFNFVFRKYIIWLINWIWLNLFIDKNNY